MAIAALAAATTLFLTLRAARIRRSLRALAGLPSWPLDYIDTGGLAITKRERGCSGTPTWHLRVTGALDPAHVHEALARISERYPLLGAHVHALDGTPPWTTRYRYVRQPSFRVDDIFRVLDLSDDPDSLLELLTLEQSRHLDLFKDYPVTLTMVILGATQSRLIFRQHHAIADGRAFIGLLVDFTRTLEEVRSGRPAATLAIVPRRSEAEPLGLTPSQQRRETLAGFGVLTRIYAKALLRPLRPLLQNLGNDYSGANATVHWVVADSVLADWNGVRKAMSVSLNSLLTGAWFIALRRWHQERGARVGRTSSLVLLETRPRDRSFLSFANHLALHEVEVQLDRVGSLHDVAQEVQQQMDADRHHRTALRRMLAERWLIRFVPLVVLQRIALDSPRPAQSTSFSNLLPLPFPTLEGAGWRVDEVFITSPVQPRTGISLTVMRYNGQVVFNLNHKDTVVGRDEVLALGKHFAAVLAEAAGVEPGGRWC